MHEILCCVFTYEGDDFMSVSSSNYLWIHWFRRDIIVFISRHGSNYVFYCSFFLNYKHYILAAGHIPARVNEYSRKMRMLAATHVTFSPDGRDLLVNLGGEQIYLYNIHDNKKGYRLSTGTQSESAG